MKRYTTEYIQNTVLFFIITIVWNLLEGKPLNWVQMIIQSLIFGIVITVIMVFYSRRKNRKKAASSGSNNDSLS